MEEKKDISLSTKIILVGMSFVPVVFSGFLTYFNKDMIRNLLSSISGR